MGMRISGTMINYYFVCKRKLWLFHQNLQFEEGNERVLLGKLIDQQTYASEKKQIQLDQTINIDFLDDWRVIHEVKKSRSMEESAVWQVRYYIYYLREKGIPIEMGVLDYPKLHQRMDVFLDEKDTVELKRILDEIEAICLLEKAPLVIDSPVCKKCAYYEYCYS